MQTDSGRPKNTQSKTGTAGSEISWTDLWSNPKVVSLFSESFRVPREYLKLARNTESPKQYHLWSLISLTSALVANHAYLSRGIGGRLKLNTGIVLMGRPAIRKSSAISFMQRFAENLPLNSGPTDTAGARHGIMTAMQSRWQDDVKVEDDETVIPESSESLADASFDSIVARLGQGRTRSSSIYFASKELGRLLTAQTRELLDFFADGLDGEPIFYQTKTGNIRLPIPLINLLGATTPGNLPSILPRDAHDHGLLSRLIFVYAGKSEKAVPIPPEISEQELAIQEQLLDDLIRIMNWSDGEVKFSEEAEAEYRLLYSYDVPTLEFRLNAYAGRRPDHLARLAAILCLLRSETPFMITREDVGLAHLILILTEIDMDGAYMSLDKTLNGKAYSIIREVIESMAGPHKSAVLISHLTRAGFSDDDATKAIRQLLESRRIELSGDVVRLGGSIGGLKAALYIEGLAKRIESDLTGEHKPHTATLQADSSGS